MPSPQYPRGVRQLRKSSTSPQRVTGACTVRDTIVLVASTDSEKTSAALLAVGATVLAGGIETTAGVTVTAGGVAEALRRSVGAVDGELVSSTDDSAVETKESVDPSEVVGAAAWIVA